LLRPLCGPYAQWRTIRTRYANQVTISTDAQRFIGEHRLDASIRRLADEFNLLARQGLPIHSFEITLDEDFEGEQKRLLVNVIFDADIRGAYDAWKDVRPGITRVAEDAEANGLIAFEFSGNNKRRSGVGATTGR
jgi:hypothetical protein